MTGSPDAPHGMVTRRLALGAILSALPLAALPLVALPLAARAQGSLLDQGRNLLRGAGGGSTGSGGQAGAGLSTGEIGSGLKQALDLAAKRVVSRLGKTDGYFGDPAIKIPLPGPLEQIAGPLRSIGGAGLLDDLQLRMNRAAEQAAPKALNIFTGAVSKMSIDDARGILNGPKDAATQYFRRTTSGELTTAFRPIVDRSLSDVGAVGAFRSAQAKAATLPLAGGGVSGFNLTDFTVGKALDGLFHYMAVEEDAIRTNPAARTTDLLKKVFG